MTCDGILCREPATTTRAIRNPDGSVTPWNLCQGCASAYDIELADREAKNAATEAQWDRDADARRSLYGR